VTVRPVAPVSPCRCGQKRLAPGRLCRDCTSRRKQIDYVREKEARRAARQARQDGAGRAPPQGVAPGGLQASMSPSEGYAVLCVAYGVTAGAGMSGLEAEDIASVLAARQGRRRGQCPKVGGQRSEGAPAR
jgi:hypothetical protein